jgi:hypothetical protein
MTAKGDARRRGGREARGGGCCAHSLAGAAGVGEGERGVLRAASSTGSPVSPGLQPGLPGASCGRPARVLDIHSNKTP